MGGKPLGHLLGKHRRKAVILCIQDDTQTPRSVAFRGHAYMGYVANKLAAHIYIACNS